MTLRFAEQCLQEDLVNRTNKKRQRLCRCLCTGIIHRLFLLQDLDQFRFVALPYLSNVISCLEFFTHPDCLAA